MLKIIYGLLLIYLLTTEAAVIPQSITTDISSSSKSTNQSSILSQLAGDKNVCPASSILKTSKFTQVCGNLSLPEQEEITVQNINQFLCSAVWHRAVKFCNLTSNPLDVETKVGEFMTQDPEFKVLGQVCSHWKTNETFRYNKTQKFVDLLSSKLKKDKLCMDLCVDKDKLNGLCVLVYFVDQFIDDLTVKKEQVEDVKVQKEVEKVKDEKVEKVDDKEQVKGQVKVDEVKVDKSPVVQEKVEKESDKVEGKSEKIVGEKSDSVLESIPTEESFPSENNINNIFATDPEITNDDGDDLDVEPPVKSPVKEETKDSGDVVPRLSNMPKEDDDSHFFGYFSILGLICGMGGCVLYHHKQKVLAILLEGRRSRGGRGRRRPSTANYRKLDCTLEEAVTSQCSSNATNVIY